MDKFTVGLRYGLEQAKLTVAVETDTEVTSISGRYFTFRLPHSISAAKSAVTMEGGGKAEVEVIYDDDLPTIGLELKVTSGASSYPVGMSITGPDGAAYTATGKSGETVGVEIPISGHANADQPPHNSILPPEEHETITAADVATVSPSG